MTPQSVVKIVKQLYTSDTPKMTATVLPAQSKKSWHFIIDNEATKLTGHIANYGTGYKVKVLRESGRAKSFYFNKDLVKVTNKTYVMKPQTKWKCIHCKKFKQSEKLAFSRRGAECDTCLEG